MSFHTRHTKIIATLGPASHSPEMITKLALAGVNAFRLNFSHGTQETHAQSIASIRAVEKECGLPLGIIADLQGPKYRVGTFEQPVVLHPGASFSLDLDDTPGSHTRVMFPHHDVYDHVQPHEMILIDDGKIRLQIEAVSPRHIQTRVIVGGEVSSHKGVNLPDTHLKTTALTEKDHHDLTFALAHDVEYIALSFVQTAADVMALRHITGPKTFILSKIEKPEALKNIEAIIAASDGILVARGDLGVEMLPEDVPGAQRKLVRVCRQHGKPVIIATQMMESMIHAPLPTRAEASDVANAVLEEADAVMLSGETAAGEYPEETVLFMDRILRRAEAEHYVHPGSHHPREEMALPLTIAQATTRAATWMVDAIHSKVIVTLSYAGKITLRAAQQRPHAEIFAVTATEKLARQLGIVWGVTATHSLPPQHYPEMVGKACDILLAKGWVIKGDPIVMTTGTPFKINGSTNILRVVYAGHPESYGTV